MIEPASPRSILRVVSPDELFQREQAEFEQQAAQEDAARQEDVRNTALASHIRAEFETMRNHRSSASGWNDRLLAAQRVFNGEYDPVKLAEIRKFGGSDVYARLIAVKCRGASALLRDVYLGSDRPWGLDPTPDPTLPDNINEAVAQLVQVEVQTLAQHGQPVDLNMIKDRTLALMNAAKIAAKKKAREEARKAEDRLDDILVEGGFYKSFAEFLVDLPLFPFAAIKGPVVRIVPTVVWQDGVAVTEKRARMFWNRVSPFDLYFSPGVSDIEDATVIERVRLTRGDLNELLGLPGYDEEAIREVLQDYAKGLHDWLDPTDSERAVAESRENPHFNRSGLIDCLEYHGSVQGQMLLDWGFAEEEIEDPVRDYHIQAWLIGRHVIKVQLSPSPRQRHPYYISSFEKVPGTPIGNALPDILGDLQDVCNATLRALVNNLSISSGPQVVINMDRMAPGADAEELYPWKRWYVSNDPLSANSSQKPVDFFQPNSNAQELLGIYEKITQFADELSAIPRYITGSDRMGGAGRTASGLAMLMGNASKILQTVAANIDRDVVNPLLTSLYDMVMLTDETGMFRGDEEIHVRGVEVAVQRETDRTRQIELLQVTANPIDAQIMGPEGRARLLRAVSSNVGLEGEPIVPSEEELAARMQAMQEQAMAQQGQEAGAQAQGNQAPRPGSQALGVEQGKAMRGVGG
jgi:hypothetical protein